MAAKPQKPTTSQTVTAGTTIRFEQPKSNRGAKSPLVAVVHEANPTQGFVSFLRQYAVVGLAVGFVVGAQAQALMRSLLDSFINPLFLLLGGTALSKRVVTLHWHDRSAAFAWGAFVYSLLNFLFVLAAIYVIIKFLSLDKFDEPKEEKKKS
jgi:large-conductance mechanosensitive channel